MPELDTITVKGFKSIASIEDLKLRAINVVIGPNGSGKSNFVEVFGFLHAIGEGHLQDYVMKAGGADKLLYFGAKVTDRIEIRISFEAGAKQYEIGLEATDDDTLFPRSEAVAVGNGEESRERVVARHAAGEAGISSARLTGIASFVRAHLGRWHLYHFHDTSATSPMKRAADIDDNYYLRPDGANLSALLHLLERKHPRQYSLIRRTVGLVAPFFDDFVLQPQKLNKEKIRLQWRHRGSDAYFGPSSLSDGTLRFIALATLLLLPEEHLPSVILLDEPELGLHPFAITMLASLIKQASHRAQVILATQSPILLDHFEPEDVLVAERADGGTQLRRLEARPLARWLKDYSLGQLWEKNELGGRPRPEYAHGQIADTRRRRNGRGVR
jgi:predicted ATPase